MKSVICCVVGAPSCTPLNVVAASVPACCAAVKNG